MNLEQKHQWDCAPFIERLTRTNRLAAEKGFRFVRVPSLGHLSEVISRMQQTAAFVFVSDMTNGTTNLHNTPRTTRTKTVVFAMRYPVDNTEQREKCLTIIRELFRQFASVLIQEKTKLGENMQFLDPNIRLTETNDLIMPGVVCAYYELAVTTHIDLQYNPAEWNTEE